MKAVGNTVVPANSANDSKVRQDFLAMLADGFGYNVNVAEAMVQMWQNQGFVISRCEPKPNN